VVYGERLFIPCQAWSSCVRGKRILVARFELTSDLEGVIGFGLQGCRSSSTLPGLGGRHGGERRKSKGQSIWMCIHIPSPGRGQVLRTATR